jgi:hypothetical protein
MFLLYFQSAMARLEKTRRYIALKTSDLYNRYAGKLKQLA